ncbi:tRNA (adenosine(37)-N6)-threonylcarbamoyltransferase complex ATPase subunit type 1 TsaE [Paenibacillus validus]|uniref:tRNA threonylcarbamoyladenosine biosynthesis protein TsaE n=1 Tax=Paenibacillus validus TaxID=44253 RepID=A0A7X2ZDF4_9BACL|nr:MULTISPECIES: tRNA (adenosine(37)-N6)-threonylcarbamoyltransferase complex ATPase subunit type 1 TsaE [Paenibacillus]MED4602889.1 tRNA (adenosine(37)-N6)-threonylcarbamoyltransferase complex ATPase subunit type 1 TsaE [Paenibacillus validus]MED4607175.1 tRNA (adenosine(37)-N6)-threonylcarbamoyltransferase complex ATPase subunit type 1 TsaE [Paenibacillus validus]MUG72106.1 tRNA (adenosine(37)-N6)-threonylcarbamoyltransferase complex ATPase subunit type 1 TsaE [Paenibacillus validus]
MSSYVFIAHGLEDTVKLAARLASLFVPGTVIALDGELGAGKTAFSQAVAKAIGVEEVVNSPTFTIIKEYEGTKLPFYHMDVYRLSLEEADELGLDDYFYGEGITLIEWASLIEELLPPERLSIQLEHGENQSRRFRIVPKGEPYRQWCIQLKENGLLL